MKVQVVTHCAYVCVYVAAKFNVIALVICPEDCLINRSYLFCYQQMQNHREFSSWEEKKIIFAPSGQERSHQHTRSLYLRKGEEHNPITLEFTRKQGRAELKCPQVYRFLIVYLYLKLLTFKLLYVCI